MKILFVSTADPGHLDFGGLGFVRLARALGDRGHEITWLSWGPQLDRLARHGIPTRSFPALHILQLPSKALEALATDPRSELVGELAAHLKMTANALRLLSPDLVCVDRALAMAALAFEHLDLPYVAVGTPGGYWSRTLETRIHEPRDAPDPAFGAMGRVVTDRLGWSGPELTGCWVRSPLLNVAFVGRDFLPVVEERAGQAFVDCFSGQRVARDTIRVGVSFGNTGLTEVAMEELARRLARSGVAVEIYAGRREALRQRLAAELASDTVTVHGWTDFAAAVPRLSALAFFGGIGTIWHCLDAWTPMISVHGLLGDQGVNGRSVAAHGLGAFVDPREAGPETWERTVACVTDAGWTAGCQEAIGRQRAPDRFTDTLETLCDRLETLS